MANLNQLANKKLANGLTWFQCKGVTEINGEKKLTSGSQFAKFANFFPLQYFPMHGMSADTVYVVLYIIQKHLMLHWLMEQATNVTRPAKIDHVSANYTEL